VDILVAGIAVVAFAAVVYVLVGVGGHTRPQHVRTVLLPDDDEGWMTLQQVATVLELPPAEVVDLVDRDSIPFFVVRGGRITEPQ
jgi:hypothetical protein